MIRASRSEIYSYCLIGNEYALEFVHLEKVEFKTFFAIFSPNKRHWGSFHSLELLALSSFSFTLPNTNVIIHEKAFRFR